MSWMVCVTRSMPLLCSALAWVISPMMSVIRCTLATTPCMVLPAWLTSWLPSATFSTESAIRRLISLAASALRPARLRTSPATTAKPRPCSPARAASTAAFSARMLVWKAMPSMVPMMSAICFELWLMSPMVAMTPCTTSPPRAATLLADAASWVAVWAVSAFWRTVAFISSIDAAVCSRLAACSSVRCDRSVLPLAISPAPVRMESAPLRTWVTICTRPSRMPASAANNSAISSRPSARMSALRSPPATAWAKPTA
mmetsp:Transcript_5840/g.22860  ORF Transcript_5840/g.22860 Transcript_5840/m.22860 type:complete len:257 (+) Transcript_5840:1117-1887(+)